MRCRMERSQADTAGRDENLRLRLPRPMGKTKHWRTEPGAPDTPDGSKYRWCGHRYRTAHHKSSLAPSVPDRILQSRSTWTRQYSPSRPCPISFWGWSPVLASDSNNLPLNLTAVVRAVPAP